MNLKKLFTSDLTGVVRGIIKVFLLTAIATNSLMAQEFPRETILSQVKYNPPSPLPGYLQPFNDENFDNKVTRISAISEFGGIRQDLTHDYSKRQVWNSDQSLLSLSYGKVLDGNSYKLLASASIGNLGWSNVHPYRNYETTVNSNYFRVYELNPKTFENVTVFTKIFSEYNRMAHWTAETNISADDKYVALYGTKTSTGNSCWVVVYNIQDDIIVSETNIGTAIGDVDWVSISQSGDYVVILYENDGSGRNQGTKSYDRNMNLVKHLTNSTQHGDLGYDQNGNEVWVFYDMGYLKSTILAGNDGIIQYAYMQGGHVSCRNINRPGWAYVTDNGDANSPNDYPAFREVFAVKLDGKPNGVVTVNRFSKHYTKSNGNYNHYAKASVSPDGTKVIFNSNMTNVNVESQSYPFAFVVEVEQLNNTITANAGVDKSICQGTSTTLTASGGSTYLWNTGATTESITVSPDETTTYTVTAYDSTGNNSDTDEVTVTVNPLPEVTAGADVTIEVGDKTTLTATGADSYLWSTGETTPSIEVSPTSTTIYTVIGTTNKCEASDSVTVFSVEASVKANAGEDTDICKGTSTTLTASGGTNYVWSTGETTESIKVSPNTTATYTVIVSDNNGQSDEASVTVTVNPIPTANAGEDQTICKGETATLTATGGASYLWSTGETTASIEVNPTVDTVYSVEVSNNNCSSMDEVSVFVHEAPELKITGDSIISEGDFTTLTVSGGDNYEWNTGEATASITVSPKVTTTYSVSSIGSNGCSGNAKITITVAHDVVANAGQDIDICAGTSTTLTASGGSTYLWSTGATTESIEVSPSETTIYSVTVYDSTGTNADTDEVTVTVNPLPAVDAGSDSIIDSGESVTLTAKGANSYKWSTGETDATINVSPTATTTYTVIGTSDGCEATDTVKVTVKNTVEVVANAGKDQTICAGSSTTLTATGGASYLWNTGAKTASIEVNPSSTTTYSVTAYDESGKYSDTDEVKVIVNALPTVDAGSNVTINSGEKITLTATGSATNYKWSTGETGASITVNPTTTSTYTVTGANNGCEVTDTVKVIVRNTVEMVANAGKDLSICAGSSTTLTASGGSTYLWSTGATTQSIDVDPSATTIYSVTVYDSTGTKSDTDEVTVSVLPLPTVDAGKDRTINSGDSITLIATGATSYKWSTGETGASITVSPSTTKTYTVTGTSNGCEAKDTVKITVKNTVEVVANAGADQRICSGSSTTLTASGGSTYLWSTGATTASINVSPATTTIYSVTAYDDSGKYSDSDEVKVTVNDLPTVSAGKNITIKAGESTKLTASGATSYKWSTGESGESITVSPASTKTYKVTGIRNGCEATVTVKVTVENPQVVVARAGGNKDICQGSKVTLTATGGERYLWSTGAKTASITVNPKSTTKYSVTAFVGNASDTDEAVVNVSPKPNVTIINGSEATVLEGEFITLSAKGADRYQWSNGATQPNIAVRPTKSKSYSVVGYVNDCSSEKSIKVNVFEKIVANAGEDVAICHNESTVLTARGPANSEYLWSTGETTKSITVSPDKDTEYSVMVYHALDSDTDNVMVKVRNCETSQIVDDSVAIEEEPALEFIIYPNPTDGEVHIKVSGLTNVSSIHLYDLSGKSLYNEAITVNDHHNFNKTLNLSDFASGIYLLQLVDNQRVITKKIVLR